MGYNVSWPCKYEHIHDIVIFNPRIANGDPAHFRHYNSVTAKDQAMRFRDFSWIWMGYKMLCSSVVHHLPKSNMAA